MGYLFAASDGIWDCLSIEDVARVLCEVKCPGLAVRQLAAIAMALWDADGDERDDISAVLVDLRGGNAVACSAQDILFETASDGMESDSSSSSDAHASVLDVVAQTR